MSNSEIRQLLAKLQDEIQKTDLDVETRSLVQQLDADIHELLESDTVGAKTNSVVERAKALETNFASEHPAAERFMREVIDTLVRMGI
jgi:hypothetical protein